MIKILEIGCGPGILTVPLLKRGFHVTAMDPSSAMIREARVACEAFSNVVLSENSFADFESSEQFDAIVAASSLHWALAEENRDSLIRKLHSLLLPKASLVLLWNFPPEPSERIRSAVADALNEAKPFYFGSGGDTQQHELICRNVVLTPLEESHLFSPFETLDQVTREELQVTDYINYLRTLSTYIHMSEEKKGFFFPTAEKVLLEHAGPSVDVVRKSVLNISSKVDCETFFID